MGKSLFTGCVSAPNLDDVGMPFVADVKVRAELRQGNSLPKLMAESLLACVTVDRVASCGIQGRASSRGRARARRKWYPRSSSVSGKAEFALEGRSALLSY
jgi:hypothetical protein